jgi:TfoX/Sxy family transcriptional regulator of competence genes
MPDDQDLAANVRAVLARTGHIREVTMFGGIGFMLNGKLVAAASRRGLLLRVGKDRQAEALAQSGARPMVMRGRTMEGYGIASSAACAITTPMAVGPASSSRSVRTPTHRLLATPFGGSGIPRRHRPDRVARGCVQHPSSPS